MLTAAHYFRVFLFLLAGSAGLVGQEQPAATPREWPRTGPGYTLPEITAEAVGARQTGVHRAVPHDALQAGAWEVLSNGEHIWNLSIESRRAMALRVHISSFRPDAGVLYVSGEKSFHEVTERGESWSATIPGDRLWVHYRPHDPTDAELPFAIDLVSHVLRVEEDSRGYLQVERDGSAWRCEGWPLEGPAGSGMAYFLATASCIPDAMAAATAMLWHGGEAHQVRPMLVALRRQGEVDFSLVQLGDAPGALPFAEVSRPEIKAVLPHVASFVATKAGTGERGAESVRGACVVQPISFGTAVAGELSASDCLSPGGKYFADTYSFTGSANQRVSMVMTSQAVDSYLTLYHPNGAVVARNDDGGGGANARIEAVLSSSGVYRLEASTFHEYTTGAYVLRLDTSGIVTSGALAQRFVAVSPCRVMDTRTGEGKTGVFGPPAMQAGTSRDIGMAESNCGIPPTATAFSLNVTVVPRRGLSYLTAYPAGQVRPVASTLNSFEGRVVSNAALIPAGSNGRISIFVTDDTDVIVDINGFFTP